MSEKSKRNVFLQTQWSPYPRFNPQARYWGRFLGILDGDTGQRIELKSFQEEHFFKNQNLVLHPVKNLQFWKEILISGDIIEINEKNEQLEIALLAPYLAPTKYKEFIPHEKWEIIKMWSDYLHLARSFFKEKKFVELSTPLIVNHPGSEPSLDPFEISLKLGNKSFKKYLPTSPELHLKKVLTSGIPKIFEITKSFRNNEFSEKHCPEFWILEWYRNFSNLEEIKKDVQDLIGFIQTNLPLVVNKKKLEFKSVSFQEIFSEHYHFSFNPETNQSELEIFCKDHHLNYLGVRTIEDLFSLISFEKIETKLNPQVITFLEKYPPYAAALAQTNEQGWAERFEVYWQGHELANAFFELNDMQEQKNRFKLDNELKKQNSLAEIAVDEEFIFRLSTGLPPCAGIALGLERLFMTLFGLKDIKDLKLFSTVFLCLAIFQF